jgi:hypothetical protein
MHFYRNTQLRCIPLINQPSYTICALTASYLEDIHSFSKEAVCHSRTHLAEAVRDAGAGPVLQLGRLGTGEEKNAALLVTADVPRVVLGPCPTNWRSPARRFPKSDVSAAFQCPKPTPTESHGCNGNLSAQRGANISQVLICF